MDLTDRNGSATSANNLGQTLDSKLGFSASNTSKTQSGIVMVLSISAGVFFLVILLIAFILWKKNKRASSHNHSSATISKAISSTSIKNSNQQAGVIQTERIEFVLPSYTSTEMTEEEASEQEPGQYRYSYIHGAGGGNLLTVPNQSRRGEINPYTIAPALYLSSEGEGEQDAWCPPNGTLGKIGFSLRYKRLECQLLVTILGASNLPTKRRKTVSNPHVKVTLLPDKHPKLFTKILKNTSEPVYNEEFFLFLKPEDAPSRILKITMCDFDKFSRRIAIGHVFVPLKNLGINTLQTDDCVLLADVWKNLVPKYLDSEEFRGEISLSLCYNSDIRTLRLGIHKVKNLNSPQEEKDIACLYAKVTLFEDGKVIKTRKTSAKKKTFEPDFAEAFNIKITRDRTQSLFCMISVCSRNRYGARKVIGRTQIGPYTHVSGPGADHWSDAFQSPKSTVTQWHALR